MSSFGIILGLLHLRIGEKDVVGNSYEIVHSVFSLSTSSQILSVSAVGKWNVLNF